MLITRVKGGVTADDNGLGLVGTAEVGNVELTAGTTKAGNVSVKGSIAEGTASINQKEGFAADGKIGSGEVKYDLPQVNSSASASGSLLPQEWKVEVNASGANATWTADDFKFGVKGNFGPIEIEVNINPVVAGAQGGIIAGQAAKQATGKAPPTPMIYLLNSIFGIGK